MGGEIVLSCCNLALSVALRQLSFYLPGFLGVILGLFRGGLMVLKEGEFIRKVGKAGKDKEGEGNLTQSSQRSRGMQSLNKTGCNEILEMQEVLRNV